MGAKILGYLMLLVACGSAPRASASPETEFEYSKLSYDDLGAYAACHRIMFLSTSCSGVLDRLCENPKNNANWDCIDRTFAACQTSDFTAAGCEDKLTYVCDRTSDHYD